MSRFVSNLGGAFIYSENPEALANWYHKHLAITFESAPDGSAYYASFFYTDLYSSKKAYIAWSILRSANRPANTKEKLFAINYRVFDAEETVKHLRSLGVEVKGVEVYPEGKFAWCSDAEGNAIELWEDTPMP